MELNAIATPAPDYGVHYTLDGALAVIELRRPKAANALDEVMKRGLHAALDQIHNDRDRVRSVLITAKGGNFCVGQDLKEHAVNLEADPDNAFATLERDYNPLILALRNLPYPVVAAVEGNCAGAGLSLALCADIRVAGQEASFSAAFARIGLAPDSGLSATLPEAVGSSRATQMFLLGESIDAATALEWGLAHRVVPAGQAAEEGRSLANRLADGATTAFREFKGLIRSSRTLPLAEVLEAEFAAQKRAGRTTDHLNAVDAFLNRQRPTYTGH